MRTTTRRQANSTPRSDSLRAAFYHEGRAFYEEISRAFYDEAGVRDVLRSTICAEEEQRKQISQDMHDRLSNAVALIAFSVRQLVEASPENSKSRRELEKVLNQITDLGSRMRAASQSIYPLTLQYVGIKGILRGLQYMFEKINGIRVRLILPEELPRISDEAALCFFRVAQHCLQNLAEHAGNEGVTLALGCKSGSLRLNMNISANEESLKAVKRGFAGMESRALALGGNLILRSLESGAEIQLSIPL